MLPESFDNCSVLRFLFGEPFIEVLGCFQQTVNKWAMSLHGSTAIRQVVVDHWMPWQRSMVLLSRTMDGGNRKKTNKFIH